MLFRYPNLKIKFWDNGEFMFLKKLLILWVLSELICPVFCLKDKKLKPYYSDLLLFYLFLIIIQFWLNISQICCIFLFLARRQRNFVCVINAFVSRRRQRRSVWLQRQTSATHSDTLEWLQHSQCLPVSLNQEELNLIKWLRNSSKTKCHFFFHPLASPFVMVMVIKGYTLQHSVMVMLNQCQHLWHCLISEGTCLQLLTRVTGVLFSCFEFRADLSYSEFLLKEYTVRSAGASREC